MPQRNLDHQYCPSEQGISQSTDFIDSAIGLLILMHTHGNSDGPSMDQAIFNLGLPVETISVYLLACGLADVGKPVTTKNLTEIWNGTADSLDQSLRELEERNIIARVLSDGKDRAAYKVKEVHRWKRF
jgi:hypothetical protein